MPKKREAFSDAENLPRDKKVKLSAAKLSNQEWDEILRKFFCSQSNGKNAHLADGVSYVFGWPQSRNTTSSMWHLQPTKVI